MLRTRFTVLPLASLILLGLSGAAGSTLGPEPSWVANYNVLGLGAAAGKAVAVDEQGNSYVTGYGFRRGAELDFVTIKYGPDGRRLWQANFDGTTHHTDVPSAIALDGAGNVYVAGRTARAGGTDFDYVLLKYSPTGQLLWLKKRPGSPFVQSGDEFTPVHLAVDPAGNAYVSGYAPGGFRTTKYSTFGAELWSDAFGADGAPLPLSGFNQIALTADGGLLAAGAIAFDLEGSELLVVRYSPTGERESFVRPSPDGAYVSAQALVAEPGGGFSVAGVERQSASATADLLVARFAANGTELWSHTYARDSQSEDVPAAIARDAEGNLIVTGSTQRTGQSGTADVVTLKYDADGTFQWLLGYDGPRSGEDRARALRLDENGSIYVAATVDGGEQLTQDYALLKVSAAGDLLSAACYDGPAAAFDDVAGLAVDAQGNATLTGISAQSGNPVTGYDYGIATVRYDSDATSTPALEALGLAATQVRGKKSVQGLIRLNDEVKAKSVVQLQSSHPNVLPVPASGVIVKRERATALFTLRSKRVTEPTEVTITATFGGVSKEAVITVRP